MPAVSLLHCKIAFSGALNNHLFPPAENIENKRLFCGRGEVVLLVHCFVAHEQCKYSGSSVFLGWSLKTEEYNLKHQIIFVFIVSVKLWLLTSKHKVIASGRACWDIWRYSSRSVWWETVSCEW